MKVINKARTPKSPISGVHSGGLISTITQLINIEPISVNVSNRLNFKTKVMYKDSRTKEFYRKMDICLKERQEEYEYIEEFSKSSPICIEASFVFGMPENKMLTKAGTIKKTGGDVDNLLKNTIDALFSKNRYLKNVDDSQILEISRCKKVLSNYYYINYQLDFYHLKVVK